MEIELKGNIVKIPTKDIEEMEKEITEVVDWVLSFNVKSALVVSEEWIYKIPVNLYVSGVFNKSYIEKIVRQIFQKDNYAEVFSCGILLEDNLPFYNEYFPNGIKEERFI